MPIVYHEREGEETLDSFRDGWRHIRFMFVNAPGYLYSIPGLLLGLFGVAVMSIAYTGISFGGVTLGTNSMIAGSLFTILGVQVGSLGVFAAAAGNPIQEPSDRISRFIIRNATLERGASVGFMIFLAGTAYAIWLLAKWVASGFEAVPFTAEALFTFTVIVIGVYVVFSSFFLSSVE